jgi:hypothetical protein
LVLAFAAVLELLVQSLRAFFPLAYNLVGSLGFVLTPLVLIPVFAAPLLYPLLARWAGVRGAVLLAGALAGARLALQASPTLALAILAVVVGLLAVTAALPIVASGRFGPDAIAAGTLVGLGLDVAFRTWRVTDDVVWSGLAGVARPQPPRARVPSRPHRTGATKRRPRRCSVLDLDRPAHAPAAAVASRDVPRRC